MNSIEERIAYLKGLCEGMDIDTDKGEGKLLAKIIEALGDIAEEMACMQDDAEELQAQVDEIDEDLSFVEEVVYEDEEDCDCCNDFDCADIECPNCGETIMIDSDVLDEEGDCIICPACGHEIEIDCDCDCDCDCCDEEYEENDEE
ncbi:MAG: hypothetical protein PUB07_06440 [Clostridia bacterium]|nr:hypothetical protein [Clostridia bacterium]